MSILARWSIRSFGPDALQHWHPPPRTPSSSSLRRSASRVFLCHDGHRQYGSASSPATAKRGNVDNWTLLDQQTRHKDAKHRGHDHGHGPSSAHQNDRRRLEKMTQLERYEYRLEEFLPDSLRRPNSAAQKPWHAAKFLKILVRAQWDERGPANLLSRLVLVHNRPEAALFFVDRLLDNVVARNSAHAQSLPLSTLAWSDHLTYHQLKQPVELTKPENALVPLAQSLEDQYQNLSSIENSALVEVWQFLGYLIVAASNTKSAEDASRVMSLVYQTLAKLHHLGLVPDNIYDWSNSPFSSAVQHSPVLYLLSSRILSTLSDASWRSYQDEAISRDQQLGISYRQTQDPPGGRFRLKVRDLGPETWLEFVLWCCVESDCSKAAAVIVSLLAEKQSDRWSTSSWTLNAEQELTIQIDWDRVKSRPGGAVGRFEGYSHDDPLARIPPRTISVEVTLAIIEAFVDAGYQSGGSPSRSPASRLITVQKLLAFLRPHSLPQHKIEYICARLFDAVAPSLLERPQILPLLTEAVSTARSLASSSPPVPISTAFASVIDQSQLHVGILQAVMHARCCQGEVRKAIKVFDQIQEMVDRSKIQAIASFLALPPDSSQPGQARANLKDFAASHVQLPFSQSAAFLDVLTENNVIPVSEWLIYSTDVDGPLIPMSAFQRQSISSALIRYAGANYDLQLLQYVRKALRRRRLKTSVTVLRLEANAYMQCFEFGRAGARLKALRSAIAGGFHPDNLASLAASILRLEADYHSKNHKTETDTYLAEAVALMRDMLRGQYDGTSGDFTIEQKQLFKQQVGHLLQIFDGLASLKLNLMALSFEHKFPSSNIPTLDPRTFNILLRAIVQIKGAVEGVRIWDQFCTRPVAGKYDIMSSSEYDDSLESSPDDSWLWDGSDDDDNTSLYTDHTDIANAKDENAEILNPFDGTLDEDSQGLGYGTGPDSDVDSGVLLKTSGFKDFIPISSPGKPDPKPDPEADAEADADADADVEFIDENLARMKGQRRSPLVAPNLRTLMIIVNKAMSEASVMGRPLSDAQVRRAIGLLRSPWMRDRFGAFGIIDEYRELLAIIGEAAQPTLKWYPSARTGPFQERMAAERSNAISVLFSSGGKVGKGPKPSDYVNEYYK